MAINTTSSIKKASTSLGKKCEKTLSDMKQLMQNAGVPEYKTVKVFIPKTFNSDDDVLFVGLNGVGFYFKRNTTVNMPEPLLEILQNTGEL